MMKWKSLSGLAVFLFVLSVAGIAMSEPAPRLINYQGRLADSSGQPLAEGSTVDIVFNFYTVETGGVTHFTVTQEDVVVNNGIYNVMIGSGTVTRGHCATLADVFKNHSDVWMSVAINGDGESSPRARIASVPHALNAENGTPKGGIIMWSGAFIPDGWALCDGTNGTPDLRGRFIMGARDAFDLNETGGQSDVTLAESNLPPHTHSFETDSDGAHRHEFLDHWSYPLVATFWMGGLVGADVMYNVEGREDPFNTESAGAHTHSGVTDSSGSATSFDNRPPYYKLAFIMKQ